MTRTSRVLLAVVAAGIPAAVAWWAFGRPSQWLATERGLVLTEVNATGSFQVVAMFVVVGIVFGVLAGVATHRLTRPGRWETVLGLAAASGAASLVCWRLGIWLGPPPPESVKGLEVGDEVSAQFAVDGIVPFLVWPLVAVLSYTLALYLSSDGEDDDEELADEVSERSEP
ncbi:MULTISPECIES: hypothetical protein [Aeromicrobium]|uniref:hypothetical protein n=1 Tax=Aeromicrobium TaxID=2040 RepID=UPI00257F61CB|nr:MULTISPECIES: hypothetical protein [Aeromicrobium]